MSVPSHDAELEAHLRRVIREELAEERESRANTYWWIAAVVCFGPFVLVGGAVIAVALLVAIGTLRAATWGVRTVRAHRADA